MKVSWSPELTKAIVRGLPLTVTGQATLPSPLAGLVVIARGGPAPGGKLSIAGVLQPRALLRVPQLDGLQTRSRRGGTIVEERFVVTPGLLNQLVVACGNWPVLIPLISPGTPAHEVANEAAVKDELELFSRILVNVVEGIYKAAGKDVPDLDLVLQPTGLGVEAALSALRKIKQGAADVASRGGARSSAPGRVYQPPADDDSDDSVTFDDVGGQEEAKTQLRSIVQSIKDPDAYRRWGVKPPRGLLLFGPPGTGKTLLARCLARESGAKFIHVRATDVVSKWYGEAEKKLQEAFDWARRDTPAVLFFDEIDALGRSREDAHEATHRLVSTFLENMDGLEGIDGVVILAATNRPDAVDEALTRPGRFDRLVEVGLPDRDGRRAIFKVHLRRSDKRAGRPVFEPMDEAGWDRLLDASEGFSGAEIAEAVRRALETKVRAGATAGWISQDELLAQTVSVARPW
ncbi:MAG: ATP-binding protein [Candidatus Dormibacteraeota bacterium]|nr:ATP-binding protein [Candidatus Dormibacteraeota bacterium]